MPTNPESDGRLFRRGSPCYGNEQLEIGRVTHSRSRGGCLVSLDKDTTPEEAEEFAADCQLEANDWAKEREAKLLQAVMELRTLCGVVARGDTREDRIHRALEANRIAFAVDCLPGLVATQNVG